MNDRKQQIHKNSGIFDLGFMKHKAGLMAAVDASSKGVCQSFLMEYYSSYASSLTKFLNF